MSRPSFDDLSAFEAVARHRSFRKAADALGLSRSRLSHTMTGLEARLGVRLLHRTTRSVAPTEAGMRLLERLRPVLGDLDAALDALAADRGRPSGPLRINAGKGAAQVLMRTIVPAFLAACPDVALDIVCEGALIDIVAEGFDAGVRLAESVPQDMIAVPLGGTMRFLAVAAPSYLAARAAPDTPDDLHRHRCIRQRLPSGKPYRWEFSRNGAERIVDVPGSLTLDDNDLMVQAAAAGLGIAFVPEPSARAALDEGRLVTVLEAWCPPIPGLALYYPGNRLVPSPLRAFIDTVREQRRGGEDRTPSCQGATVLAL